MTGAERAHYRELREAARERGETTYMGYPCSNGHDGKRFVNGKGRCVQCFYDIRNRAIRAKAGKKKGQHRDKARALAKELGQTTYEGRPCKVANHPERRYTSSGVCVACTKKRTADRLKKVGNNNARMKEQQLAWRLKNYPKTMWNSARNRAINGGLDFTIEIEDIIIPDVCPVLGLPIRIGGPKSSSPSLDRFDNSKGYTKENTRVISWRANSLKSDGTLEEFAAIVSYMQAEPRA